MARSERSPGRGSAVERDERSTPATNSWRTVVDWDRQGWRDDAACRETSADLFFPAGHTGPAGAQTDMAKAVCRACPVQMACLRFALDTNEDHGIWGGLDEDERRRLRRSTRELRSVRK